MVWKPYPPECWASQWHTHHPDDDRGKLTWRNRIKGVPSQCTLVNYFDSTDEVLGIIPAASLWLLVGARLELFSKGESNGSLDFFLTVRRQAWQKQEHGKGRGAANCESMTEEAGWGFRTKTEVIWPDESKGEMRLCDQEEIRTSRVYNPEDVTMPMANWRNGRIPSSGPGRWK